MRFGEKSNNVRHDAGHTDQTVHAAKADANAPKASSTDDTLTELFVTRFERQNGAVAVCNTLVDLLARVARQTRVVRNKTQPL